VRKNKYFGDNINNYEPYLPLDHHPRRAARRRPYHIISYRITTHSIASQPAALSSRARRKDPLIRTACTSTATATVTAKSPTYHPPSQLARPASPLLHSAISYLAHYIQCHTSAARLQALLTITTYLSSCAITATPATYNAGDYCSWFCYSRTTTISNLGPGHEPPDAR
jgi:hypothetical protein